jgi:Protein of unknown function (DUF4241)
VNITSVPHRWTILALAIALAGCSHGSQSVAVSTAGDRAGLKLRMTLSSTHSSFVVETRVANGRHRPVHLVSDQCGRITEVVLAHTRFEPVGRAWPGSLGAVKRSILTDQRSGQDPDSFAPRRPGDTSSKVPDCSRPERPVTLRPGDTVDERWELPFASSLTLPAVGSAHGVVRVEVVEAHDPDEPEYLDMLPTGEAEQVRRGRSLRLEEPASRVVNRRATDRPHASLGQLYDRLLADTGLRRWLAAQPVHSWREADLSALPAVLRFKAITSRYERAVTATAQPDGSHVKTHLPTRSDRARTWGRRRGTLPPGIALSPEPKRWKLAADLVTDRVTLPTGRIVVGEYLLDAQPLKPRAQPGTYPAFATLARYPGNNFDDVALATMVLSQRPTVRWREAGSVAVDGGTTTITSAEGAAALRHLFDRSEPHWERLSEEMFDSLTAHDYQVTEFSLGHGLNLALFSSGTGDGRYPVFVGFDAGGRPTRVVVDFLLLHLKWP